MKKWTVTFVDYGETCDGKARTPKNCNTKEEAQAWVRNDMEAWADKYATENIEVNFDRMCACFKDNPDQGCEWNIEEVDVEVKPTQKQIENAKKILIDNGIKEDEASIVLQAIGYALLDTGLYPEK